MKWPWTSSKRLSETEALLAEAQARITELKLAANELANLSYLLMGEVNPKASRDPGDDLLGAFDLNEDFWM